MILTTFTLNFGYPGGRNKMRISKKKDKVTACDTLICEDDSCIVTDEPIEIIEVSQPCDASSCVFNAYTHIMEAIDDLKGCDTELYPQVNEAICNLAVVAYSLK